MLSLEATPSATPPLPRALDPLRAPGDFAEFSALLAPYLPVLVRASRALLGSEDLAWDAVQETLLRLWRRGFLPTDPKPVLLHLVRRSSLHIMRCRRRRGDHEGAAVSAGACCANDPLRDLENGELRSSLQVAVARLADEFREVFERYELGGQSYESIAEELGIPVGTVRSRLSRARARLREDMARHWHP